MMNWGALGPLIALTVLVSGCESSTEPPNAVVISGVVEDQGAPVPHVLVALMRATDIYGVREALDADSTDTSGQFTLTTNSATCPDWVVAFVGVPTAYRTLRSQHLGLCHSHTAVVVDVADFWPGPYPPF